MAGKSKDIIRIIEAVSSIGLTVDKHDWEACRELFIDEPEVDYSSFSGEPGGKVSSGELINNWRNFLPGFDFTLHFITTIKYQSMTRRQNVFLTFMRYTV